MQFIPHKNVSDTITKAHVYLIVYYYGRKGKKQVPIKATIKAPIAETSANQAGEVKNINLFLIQIANIFARFLPRTIDAPFATLNAILLNTLLGCKL